MFCSTWFQKRIVLSILYLRIQKALMLFTWSSYWHEFIWAGILGIATITSFFVIIACLSCWCHQEFTSTADWSGKSFVYKPLANSLAFLEQALKTLFLSRDVFETFLQIHYDYENRYEYNDFHLEFHYVNNSKESEII